jgi:hypothetical protein
VFILPLEVGGRADKFGNRYESKWVLKQLLRVLNEEIYSVILEPIGEQEEGVDLIIRNLEGSLECHQCKAQNASKEYWDLSDLASKRIFEKAKKQLDYNGNTTYHLVSAVAGGMLNSITNRARNSNGNPEDYFNFQIQNSGLEVKKAYKQFAKYLELDIETLSGRSRVYDYLRRIYIIQYPDDINEKINLKRNIKYLFTGDVEAIYNMIVNYAIENDMLGKEITAYMLNKYLIKNQDIAFRQLHKDQRIIPRIEQLNDEFLASFIPINNSIINRNETETCYQEILSGTSFVIHGKAGSGKSGCVLELINQLKQDGIVYLALKLDRRTPESTSENYGANIGLPASPILCIDAISKDREAVIVLDQLDAIRWTNNHTQAALEVCKEMIKEVTYLNKSRQKKISIVFVCRTFDFDNDSGIKSLFPKNEQDPNNILWKNIIVGDLSDENVKLVVGEKYDELSIKLKSLLRVPNNLYIWSNLDRNRRLNVYISSSDLIKQWWDQLCYNCEMKGISIVALNTLKDAIVNNIAKTGKLMIPLRLLSSCSKLAMDQLLSNGLLLSNPTSIGFVHQSFYDYFSVEKMLNQAYEGGSIIDIVGPKEKQTPVKRYQLQMFFENLFSEDQDIFISLGVNLIENPDIRFYMKYVFLEVLGQAEVIQECINSFLRKYIKDEYWKKHLIDTVLMNHAVFVEFLINENIIENWLKSKSNSTTAFILLRSVSNLIPDEVTKILCNFAFKDNKTDEIIYNSLCWNVEDDSEEMFKFRLKLLEIRSELMRDYIHWEQILNKKPERAIIMLDILVKNRNNHRNENHHIDKKEIDKFIEAARENPFRIWDSFMPYVSEVTMNKNYHYDDELDYWRTEQYKHNDLGRTYIKMIKASAEEIAKHNFQKLISLCEPYYSNSSLIINEILLHVMEVLPSKYSDYAVNWMIENPHDRLFNYTGENDEYLYSAKKIIEKHSHSCSEKMFLRLENTLYYYHELDELSSAEYRFNYNSENRKSGNRQMAFFPYWGKVQFYLLPALEPNRISAKTKNLICVLQRRFKDCDVIPRRNKVTGGFVGSTIASRADKISDKQWFRIITNNSKYERRNNRWPKEDEAILESSPEQFSRDLERIGKVSPNRIAKLALSFPKNVDTRYINAVLNVIGEKEPSKEVQDKEKWEAVNKDVAEEIFIKFSEQIKGDAGRTFCRAIENRASEDWSIEVLKIVCDVAKEHLDPKQGEMNVRSSKDKESRTVEMLLTNAINCTRGCAAEAIAILLWEHKERDTELEDAIKSLVLDEHLAVNMAAVKCVYVLMNVDNKIATKYFFKLAKKDIRIIAHPNAYSLFYYLFNDNTESIKDLVYEMYNSEFEDVSKTGARHIANMNLLFGCFEDIIFCSKKKTKKQKEGIIDVAIDLFKVDEFHDKAKKIIEHYLDDEEDLSALYASLIYNKLVNVEEDLDLIIKLIATSINKRMMHYFISYLNEVDVPIEGFKEIIFGMCNNIVKSSQAEVNDIRSELYGIAPDLSSLIAILYDKSQNNFEINQQCLDLWDVMFENRIGTVRELSLSITNC